MATVLLLAITSSKLVCIPRQMYMSRSRIRQWNHLLSLAATIAMHDHTAVHPVIATQPLTFSLFRTLSTRGWVHVSAAYDVGTPMHQHLLESHGQSPGSHSSCDAVSAASPTFDSAACSSVFVLPLWCFKDPGPATDIVLFVITRTSEMRHAALSIEKWWLQARNLIGEVSDDNLNLRYKACYARICDSKRKFLEAATQYYDLSTYSTVQYAPSSST